MYLHNARDKDKDKPYRTFMDSIRELPPESVITSRMAKLVADQRHRLIIVEPSEKPNQLEDHELAAHNEIGQMHN